MGADLSPTTLQQLSRFQAFVAEHPVHVLGEPVAGLPGVDDEDPAARPPQGEGSGQPGNPTPDDNDIPDLNTFVHAHSSGAQWRKRKHSCWNSKEDSDV